MNNNKMNAWLICFRILFTIGLIWTVIFIFGNSMTIAAESSARSMRILHWLNGKLAVLHLGPLSEHFVRKLAHFLEFTLLGFFAMLCLRVYTGKYIRHISWPMLFGLFTAVMDETIQLAYEGRSSQVTDVWIDFGGVLSGMFAALFILLFISMCVIVFKDRKREQA